MSRRDKVLSGLDVSHLVGVEIGPLDRPLVARADGNVMYVDHADTGPLKRKYVEDPNVNIDDIVEIDAVWGEQTLQEALGEGRRFDYVVASHVIEHVPDPITWLQEVRSVLKPSGELRLVIPDKRFTFDYLRGRTRACDVVAAYVHRTRIPLPHEIIDHALNAVRVDAVKAWDGTLNRSDLQKIFSPGSAIGLARDALANGTYHDVHCWTFTPYSLAALFEELGALGLVQYECSGFHLTERYEIEFYVAMKVSEDTARVVDSWRRMKTSSRDAPEGAQAAREAGDHTGRSRVTNPETDARHSELDQTPGPAQSRPVGSRARLRRKARRVVRNILGAWRA